MLVLWLNGTRGTARNRHVTDILVAIEQILGMLERESSWRERANTAFIVTDPPRFPLKGKEEEYARLIKDLQDRLRGYKAYPQFIHANERGMVMEWVPLEKSRPDVLLAEGGIVFSEAQAVSDIVQLCQLGCIDRVCQCRCGAWFYARFEHSKFHNKKCQQEFYRTDPAFKEHRRAYLRHLRAQHRQRVFTSTARPQKGR